MIKAGLYRVKAADIAAALLILAASISPLFGFMRNNTYTAGAADIYREDKVIKQADLGIDAVYKFKGMEIEVNKGRIRIADSDCPGQVCVHTGWISGPAQTIVCVPNKVLIEIKGGEGRYNAVSY